MRKGIKCHEIFYKHVFCVDNATHDQIMTNQVLQWHAQKFKLHLFFGIVHSYVFVLVYEGDFMSASFSV